LPIKKTLNYNHNNLFNCKIIYSSRRKRSLCVSIKDEGVVVSVPVRTSDKVIFDFIKSKEKFILKGLQKISQINSIKKVSICEREFLHFLGEKYLLKISESSLLKKGGFCEIKDNCFFVNISKFSEDIFNEKIENIIKDWYKKRALEVFCERTEYLANLHNFKYAKIKIGEQKTLWGSCNHKNNLSFNWKVVQCHIDVIDYLIIHELTHTVHKDHSHRFWNRVEEILPNYKDLKKRLKEIGVISI
jgi:predicted metal-dependent hydrolase